MTIVSKEEILKIAAISNIILLEEEIHALQNELQAVLSYAERVITITGDAQDTQLIPINVFRQDTVLPTKSNVLLQAAPETTDNYFVVPLIIEQ